jgi:hypothetical protein
LAGMCVGVILVGVADTRPRVLALDVILELDVLDAPLVASADLDAAQVTAAHERVHLPRRHVENVGDIGQLEEALSVVGHPDSFPRIRFDSRSREIGCG